MIVGLLCISSLVLSIMFLYGSIILYRESDWNAASVVLLLEQMGMLSLVQTHGATDGESRQRPEDARCRENMPSSSTTVSVVATSQDDMALEESLSPTV